MSRCACLRRGRLLSDEGSSDLLFHAIFFFSCRGYAEGGESRYYCPTLLTQALVDVKSCEGPFWWDCANFESPRHQGWIRKLTTSTLIQSGPGGYSPSPGTSPAASALVGNASQKSPGIRGWVSPVHCSNEQLSRHVSILRLVLADNDFDGNAVGLALREADSLWKKKCSQGTDRQINTSPYFTIKQPALDERFPWRSLCWLTASCISSIPSPAWLSGGSSPYLWEMYCSHRPLRHTVWAPGLLQASLLHMETKVPYQFPGWARKNHRITDF